MELWELTVQEAAEAVASRQVSARELVEALLDRVHRCEPAVRAWARLCVDRALGKRTAWTRHWPGASVLARCTGCPWG
jgi:Asp-tRNA(Asn)/Glu-tRNA(Gln) amidotransferase A subunit family amidase